MIDKAAIIKNAQKFLSKGQIDKAIAEWQKVASSYPDGNTFNFLGDLYLKKGDRTSAVDEFHKAAKVYMDEGFSLKALAIFKKVLNIDTHDTKALIALGKLNEEKNIVTDAIKYYLAAAAALSKKNKREELLDVYNKILDLAPKNIQLRVKVADLFSKEAFVSEAAREYYRVGQLYAEKGDPENARSYLMKSAEIQPNNSDVLAELSLLSERSGDLDGAIKQVQSAMEKTGEDSGLLLRYARLLSAKGDHEDAAQVVAKVVQNEPDNVEARKEMAGLYQKTGELDRAWQEYSAIIDSLISAEPGKAAEILDTFKDLDPLENRKRLVTLHKQEGDEDKAFNELYGLYDVYLQKGMNNEALECLNEALEIKPDHMEARSSLESLKPQAGAAPPAETGAPAAVLEQQDGQEKPLEVALTEADVFIRYGLYNDAGNLLEGLKARHPDSMELHLKLKTLYRETGDTEQAVTECIALGSLYERAGDEEASRASLKEAFDINPKDPRLEGKAPGVAAGASEPGSLDEHGEELSEADFYVQQGFYNEAAGVYRKLIEKFPERGELKAKLAEVEKLLSGAAPEGAAPAGAEAPFAAGTSLLDGFEIPDFGVLDEQEAAEPALGDDIQEIFDEFKKGLETEIEAEDAETHYNLGIAYKEMGLINDSIKEFQTSQHDPNYFVTASTMLGICYMQKGLYPLAVDSFSAAFMKTDAGNEASWSLKYDLASAYEKNGDIKQALQMITEVYGWKANFRDVARKLDALKKAADASAASKPSASPKKEKRSRVSYI